MSRARIANQPDLFAPADQPAQPDFHGFGPDDDFGPEEEELIVRLRAELNATLAMAQAAPRFPWPDFTRTLMAEMRFHSISETWMPAEEGARLRAAFDVEMARFYAVYDAELPPDAV